MKVCAISANLGSYDPPHEWVEQSLPLGVELEIHRLTDENFPPRHKAMTSRLQCGIPKFCGFELFDADVFLWVDASCILAHPESVQWFLEQLGDAEIAVFKHPDRSSIKAEYEFVKKKISEGNAYLTSRYRDEWLDQQYRSLSPDYVDDCLFASTAFIYRPTLRIREALRNAFFAKARWLLHDQLAFPYVLRQKGCYINVIDEHYMKTPYLTYVRNKKAVSA